MHMLKDWEVISWIQANSWLFCELFTKYKKTEAGLWQ